MNRVVGSRVQSVDKYRGTVRYLGAVPGANPSDGWIGIEWDTDGRGKHDGAFQGNRYFTCPQGKGSFVRPEMLLESITFQNALINKYASAEAADVDDKINFREANRKKAAVVCELVGKDREVVRMAKLELLKEVTLPCAAIADVGDESWIKENLPGITSLELADNLISEWTTIATLAAQLPVLHTLSLSGNKIRPLSTKPEPALPLLHAFQSLKCLVLNATGTTFQQIDLLKEFLPQLADLHLANNQISSVDCDSHFSGWPNLQGIDLSDNHVQSWDDIGKLSHFPELRRLILNGNAIKQISLPTSDDSISPGQTFKNLSNLALANNKIEDWDSIRALICLPNLTELRVQGNPFCEGSGPAVMRQLLIATFSTIAVLNGGEIRARERIEAEKFYIRHTLNQHAGATAEALAERDPILASLLQKHGAPDDIRAGGGGKAGGAGGGMVPVRLRSMAAESSHKAPISRRLPSSVTVGNLKRLCQQFFGLDVSRQRLFAKSAADGDAWAAEPMSDDLKPLSYYLGDASGGGGDGGGGGEASVEILMQEADEAVAQSEAEQAAERRRAAEEKQSAAMAGAEAFRAAQLADVQSAKLAAAAAATAAVASAAPAAEDSAER